MKIPQSFINHGEIREPWLKPKKPLATTSSKQAVLLKLTYQKGTQIVITIAILDKKVKKTPLKIGN